MRTVIVKPLCAPGVVLPEGRGGHHAYMVRRPPKPAPAPRLRPLYQRTFIKAWREYRDMSQEELAEKVGEYLSERGITEKGYTHASIGRMENGRIPYSQPIMEAISDALRVPVEALIADPPPEPGADPPPTRDDLIRLWKEVNRAVNSNRK